MNRQQLAAQKLGWSNATHGQGKTKPYRAWQAIRQRCYNTKSKAYPGYGGRGIKVCNRWKNSFEVFRDDMGPPPTPKHSIDRINNDGDYEPSNCRWATQKQQCRNYGRNRLYTINNETKPLVDWYESYKLPRYIVEQRIYKLGWSIEEALGIKPRKRWRSLSGPRKPRVGKTPKLT